MNRREQLVDAICALVEREVRHVAVNALSSLAYGTAVSEPSYQPRQPRGEVTARVLRECADWRSRRELESIAGGQIDTMLARLFASGRVERRGTRGRYEYRHVTVVDRLAEAAE